MRPLRLALPATAILAGMSGDLALAQEPAYLDDRSSPATLVESFYNAVNRKEFARAWGYFGDARPAKDLAAFSAGYEDTGQVRLLTGAVASEGAAGSVTYHLPVSIAAADGNGGEKVFAGCYVARLADPAIQGEPFRPLQLEKGSLEPSDLSLEDALPENCPGAPAPEQADAVLEKASTAFRASHPGCDPDSPGGAQKSKVEDYRIAFRLASDTDDQPEREARLFRFYCGAGAYNETHVYYQYDQSGGLAELRFATPELDIRYENDDIEGAVESVTIVGYVTEDTLVNSSYDESSHTITSANKWRGVGDASDAGVWLFRNGRFTLVKYDVDASYDGEINPETVLDFYTAP